ncbi:MAG: cereblon family protein [Desulfocapsaceae bacterium]|jgi:hypothetical protein|nr:cereblon family protein [Desulfocapsaceae bacterium]
MTVCRAVRNFTGEGFSPVLLDFRENGAKSGSSTSILAQDREEYQEKGEGVLRCRQCDAAITKVEDRISRAEKHLHTFFNPAGIVYEIGCFRRAPGCHVEGARSSEFSWFAGYSWQISFCSSCSRHLGWFFSAADDTFFGLVVDRLTAS